MKYLNNPANIRYSSLSNWLSQSKPINGFCTFTAPEYGIRALMYILHTYYFKYHCESVGEVISRYAPPTENCTDRYITFVCQRMFMKSTDKFSWNVNYVTILVKAICIYESNSNYSCRYLRNIYSKYFT